MWAWMTKLTAVAVVAVGLAIGTGGAATASTADPCMDLPVAGDGGNASTRGIQVNSDGAGTSRAGYIVGRFFVGFLPE